VNLLLGVRLDIRPADAVADDQKRISLLQQQGVWTLSSSYSVIGRPITKARDPAQALADIMAEASVTAF